MRFTLSYVVIPFSILPILAFGSLCLRAETAHEDKQIRGREQSIGFAVVELFTSQGCSSCPPADENLTQIAEFAAERDVPIYVLSMHVDYWNSLGWADPFSSEEFTRRQRQYARIANSNRVYTPQMIVNGTDGFVGSNRKEVQRAVSQAVRVPANCQIELAVEKPAGSPGTWQVNYQTTGAGRGHLITLCLVADAEPIDVQRGENSGRSLTHTGVVRTFKREPVDNKRPGSAELTWPEDQKLVDNVSVVAFVQNARTGEIIGATRAAAN